MGHMKHASQHASSAMQRAEKPRNQVQARSAAKFCFEMEFLSPPRGHFGGDFKTSNKYYKSQQCLSAWRTLVRAFAAQRLVRSLV